MDGGGEDSREIRILISTGDPTIGDYMAAIAADAYKEAGTVTPVFAETNRESDLLELAAREPFDFAVVVLNNLVYPLGKRDIEHLQNDAVAFVETMVSRFGRPLIAFDGFVRTEAFADRVIRAGAAAFFPMPCEPEAIRNAFRECLDGR